MIPIRGGGAVVPYSALWCWDEYLALDPEQLQIARRMEREAVMKENRSSSES